MQPHHTLTLAAVFENAATPAKLVMLVLLLAIIAAMVVAAIKLASGQRLAGGSAFLSGLRLGGPIIGFFGACYSGLAMTMGVANIPVQPTLKMLAPGFAESFLMIALGLLAGVVAVIAHWAVESRIDRQVLGA
jgi:biopolymer transport protein ExbB/TolQ